MCVLYIFYTLYLCNLIENNKCNSQEWLYY
nr:MAG TPA: hypothetical protein [Caudoviricetes sp.]